jgi:hypothetical protein
LLPSRTTLITVPAVNIFRTWFSSYHDLLFWPSRVHSMKKSLRAKRLVCIVKFLKVSTPISHPFYTAYVYVRFLLKFSGLFTSDGVQIYI